MSQFQLVSCDVALGGDILNVVSRHAYIPVTFPEMLVLRFLHGETAVFNVYDVGTIERDDDEEMARLTERYGAVVKGHLFPGAGMPLPVSDPRIRPRTLAETRLVYTPVDASIMDVTVPDPLPAPEPTPTPVPPPVTAASQDADTVMAAPDAVPDAPTSPPAVAPASRRPQPVNPDAAT